MADMIEDVDISTSICAGCGTQYPPGEPDDPDDLTVRRMAAAL